MKRFISSVSLSALLLCVAAGPAIAQQQGGYYHQGGGYQTYDTWQPAWDQGQYDASHIMIGRVVKFSPYRLTIEHHGNTQTLDLRGGTVIRPTGATPQPGEHIAAIGRWSNGTFIVGRLVLRQ